MKFQRITTGISILALGCGIVNPGRGEGNIESLSQENLINSRNSNSVPFAYNQKFEKPVRDEFSDLFIYTLREAETTENRIRKFLKEEKVEIYQRNRGIFGKVVMEDENEIVNYWFTFRSSKLDLQQILIRHWVNNGQEKEQGVVRKSMSLFYDDSNSIKIFDISKFHEKGGLHNRCGISFFPKGRLKKFTFIEGNVGYHVEWNETGEIISEKAHKKMENGEYVPF
jgi:hypothetical protein